MKDLTSLKEAHRKINLFGKHVVVVGGTSGIGHGIALRLAQANANVYIVGRNRKAGLEIVEEMRAASSTIPEVVSQNPPNSYPTFGFIDCDAMLMKNVKTTCDTIKETIPKIDYLVCTQGISTLDVQEQTSEGIFKRLAIHYYSRYAFPYYLQSHLLKSADAIFVSLFSAGVHSPYAQFREDPNLKKLNSTRNMVNSTGMYNDFACQALSERNPQISYIHTAPGFVATNWGHDLPFFLKPVVKLVQRFGKSKEDCAEYMCQSIFNPAYKAPGFYLLDQYGLPTKATDLQKPENVEFMWKLTEEMYKKQL